MHTIGLWISAVLQATIAFEYFHIVMMLHGRPGLLFHNTMILCAGISLLPVIAAIRRGPPTLREAAICLGFFPTIILMRYAWYSVDALLHAESRM